ncbi:MAG: D-proline reductase (dithiol) proprotein PrdA [Synergistaceae bacterium]|nr:D-proline reductase (dithiol) proprotein PrdA [Synergistaceae bacterium]
MSLTPEYVEQHRESPAVLCCRAEAGTKLTSKNFEDPEIFPDLVDSGLLNLDGALKLKQVLNGSTLTKTVDSLTPITPDIVDKYDSDGETAPVKEEPKEAASTAQELATPVSQPVPQPMPVTGGVFRLHIGEGKDIDLEIPLGVVSAAGGMAASVPTVAAVAGNADTAKASEAQPEEVIAGELTRKHFKITEVKRGPKTAIEGTVLTIREGIEKDVIANQELVKDFHLEIITPDKYHTYSETIMDVQPIATKEGEARVGEGVTRVLDGVVMMLTGVDERGVQIGEFGSSEGFLDENIQWNRPGCPDKGEIFIKGNIVIQEKTNMERRGPMAAHTAFDVITQEIRLALKELDDSSATTEVLRNVRRPGKPKIVIVKEIMGQGAMHDNFLLPEEPVGILGAKANVDLGNVPVCVSALELMDGCIHALTCIGPASKEMSRHYWREPLVLEALHDPEVDLCGVILVGSPQINAEKFYVSRRLGHTVEMLDVDGACVTTEGFGNNHIDFASHIEQIGMRGIPVVGFSFCAQQGALVVGNKYMKYMIDNNKSKSGIENEVLGCNTLCKEEAVRGMAMLKAAMAGEPVKEAERKWNPNVKSTNVELIEKALDTSIELVENEQSLPMSDKRREKYD